MTESEETRAATVSPRKERGRWSDEVRERALEMYEALGPTAAARALGEDGPGKSLITKWAKAEGVVTRRNQRTAEATAAAQASWKHRRAQLADRFGDASAEALEASRGAIATGRANDARGFMIAAAVATDKADILSGIAAQPIHVNLIVDPNEAFAALEQILAANDAARAGAIDVQSMEVLEG